LNSFCDGRKGRSKTISGIFVEGLVYEKLFSGNLRQSLNLLLKKALSRIFVLKLGTVNFVSGNFVG
jgi:hypothetical protein